MDFYSHDQIIYRMCFNRVLTFLIVWAGKLAILIWFSLFVPYPAPIIKPFLESFFLICSESPKTSSTGVVGEQNNGFFIKGKYLVEVLKYPYIICAFFSVSFLILFAPNFNMSFTTEFKR